MQVRLVDALDFIAGKDYSGWPKDLDDVRVLSLNRNKKELRRRVLQGSSSLISSDQIRRQTIKNWYIVYGDDLESESSVCAAKEHLADASPRFARHRSAGGESAPQARKTLS
jgi:hypothetical protein